MDGQLLYQAQPVENEVGGPGTGALTAHILRNVVRHGTGRRALALTAGGRQLPVGGKTGTTNDFRNAAFLGFAPRWDAGSFRAEAGYAVGVYVGYDDNTPLVNGALRLAGSSGALPAWVETIAGLRDAGLLGEPVATVGWDGTVSAQWPLAWSHGLLEVPVDPTTGLLLAEPRPEALDGEGPVVLAPQQVVPEVDYHPIQRPPRLFPRTEDWERGPANRADR